MKRALLTSLVVLVFLLLGTLAAVFYAKGYRFTPEKGNAGIKETGLLVATSVPNGASVYINDELTTATNNTINLNPGEYEVKIIKEGYFAWKKKIIIKKEVVSRADALLLPTAPKLESITNSGVANPVIDDSKSLIAYTVSSNSAQKDGVYLMDMNAKPILNILGSNNQLANNIIYDFSQSSLEFSPDGTQIMATIPKSQSTFLLSTDGLNTQPQSIVTTVLQTKTAWKNQEKKLTDKVISDQKTKVVSLINENFKNVVFSPSQEKILYTASQSADLPIVISPRLIGVNSTPEVRQIKAGNLYVYDIKEDRNYLILDNTQNNNNSTPYYIWYSDSNHLVYSQDNKINIMEFDAGNTTTVYAGPFSNNFVYPWIDGSGIVILTNLNNDDAPMNLYRLVLK